MFKTKRMEQLWGGPMDGLVILVDTKMRMHEERRGEKECIYHHIYIRRKSGARLVYSHTVKMDK